MARNLALNLRTASLSPSRGPWPFVVAAPAAAISLLVVLGVLGVARRRARRYWAHVDKEEKEATAA